MNYVKHFTGTWTDNGYVQHYKLNVDGTVGSINRFKFNNNGNADLDEERILGKSIESILKDVGFTNCKYYDTVTDNGDDYAISFLCLDDTATYKCGFYIGIYGDNISIQPSFITDNTVINDSNQGNGDGYYYGQFSGNAGSTSANTKFVFYNNDYYDLYLRVVGDLNSFVIQWGNDYGSTTFNSGRGIFVYTLVDQIDNKEYWGFKCGNFITNLETLIIRKSDGEAFEGSLSIRDANFATPYDSTGNTIALVPCMDETYPSLFYKNCFIRNYNLTDDKFYQIGNDVYYCFNLCLIKVS